MLVMKSKRCHLFRKYTDTFILDDESYFALPQHLKIMVANTHITFLRYNLLRNSLLKIISKTRSSPGFLSIRKSWVIYLFKNLGSFSMRSTIWTREFAVLSLHSNNSTAVITSSDRRCQHWLPQNRSQTLLPAEHHFCKKKKNRQSG